MSKDFIVHAPPSQQDRSPSNYISTTKYNFVTFLPFSLILQFRRYANIYFLVCAIMQSIPLISPLSPFSAIAPLVFVLSLSMAREGYQDWKRWRSDQESNSKLTWIYEGGTGEFKESKWMDVRTAQFIKVMKDQICAVDLIPLVCSAQSGISYLQTSSLDGQKNLKPKISITQIQLFYNKNCQSVSQMSQAQLSLPNFSKVELNIICSEPNADVSSFQGQLTYKSKLLNFQTKLNHKNLLLRGCKLKNTEWVVGIAVYTGENTKLMKNGCKATNKVSNIERKVNIIILFILMFEVSCSATSAIYCYFSCVEYIAFQTYLMTDSTQPLTCPQIAGISLGSYFILYSTFIPISLIVSLQFVKVFQGFFMSSDKEMYSEETQRALECHTVSINEQLGQVEYILTDKTGTLTCNKMEFRNVVIGNRVYGEEIKLGEVGDDFNYGRITGKFQRRKSINKAPSESGGSVSVHQNEVSFDRRRIDYQLSQDGEQQKVHNQNPNDNKKVNKNDNHGLQPSSKQAVISKSHRHQIELMFFMITTCHQCLREGQQYTGPSPDQVSLVTAAKNIGFQFLSTENKITTVKYKSKQYKFELIRFIEFDSDRKRMSVVVKSEGVIRVFVKGADTSIQPLLRKDGKENLQFIRYQTVEMAKTGLRSLWFAEKILSDDIDVTSASQQDIEKELNLIGATAIQDKLQDFVPQTIYALRQGGIKFIMLTGDKLQTADNIARSCKLIDDGFLIDSKAKLVERLQSLKFDPSESAASPVIDGSKINFQECEEELLDILQSSNSAVFCRVTPNQKAEIVRLVKKMGKLTLAIGDGANDVNMILQAHVGVGIFGQEGTRAAQVSNYAIGQFCILWKLLLYYGRLNYMRISEMILYFFYKNMVFTIVQFAYSFYNLGSGQSFWLSWSITFYNLAFTFFPVVLRAVFQVDVPITTTKSTFKKLADGQSQQQILYSYYPKMYVVSQKNQLFTGLIFAMWFFLGICQGVICLMITLYSIGGVDNSSGLGSYGTGFYFCEISAYTSVVIVVTVKLALNVKNWNLILVIGFLVPSLGAYMLYCFLSNIIEIAVVSQYLTQMLQMPTFYFCQVLTILGMFSFDCFLFAIEATKNNFQNYFKYRTLQGKRLSETNLKQKWLEMEHDTERK